MKKMLCRLMAVALCLTMCAPTVLAVDLPAIVVPTNGTGTKEQPSNIETEDTEIVTENVDDMPSIEEVDRNSEARINAWKESSVRAVVGPDTQIINIDGLDVTLADGKSVHLPFVDVAKDAYYTEAVAWAYANGITSGVTEQSFGPDATCTRGQMVTFLWRAAGKPEPSGTTSAFSDVESGAYYEKAVAWAVENGVTTGVGGDRFDPNGIVNRAQTVTFLYRAKGSPAATANASFADVAAGEYYADAVAWAVANGVTAGVGNNAFAPSGSCLRAQTVTFLYRAYR